MPLKLCERALLKNLLSMPTADPRQDETLNALIEQASEETEFLTRRKFMYGEYTEYYPSYDQTIVGLDKQTILVDAFPIDITKKVYLAFSPFNHMNQTVVELQWSPDLQARNACDFTVIPERGRYDVLKLGILTANFPVFAGVGFTYAERGFKTVYWGGYPLSVKPDNEPDDPLDDYGVTQVPYGLKLIVAKKAAAEYNLMRVKEPFIQRRGPSVSETIQQEFRAALKPWSKKDVMP